MGFNGLLPTSGDEICGIVILEDLRSKTLAAGENLREVVYEVLDGLRGAGFLGSQIEGNLGFFGSADTFKGFMVFDTGEF